MAGAPLSCGAAPAPVVAVQSGLSYYSGLRPGRWNRRSGSVHVDLQITATSDTVNSGGRRLLLSGSAADAASLRPPTTPPSTNKGQSLPVSVTAGEPSGVVVYVPFRQRLYSGQSTSLDPRVRPRDLGGSTDREPSHRSGHRLIPGSAFGSVARRAAWSPSSFPPDTSSRTVRDLTSSVTTAGETIFSSGPVSDSTALNAWFAASRTTPAADFNVEQFTLGSLDVTLRYWSRRPGWAAQVARVLQIGYPVIRDMIGLGDPTIRTLTVEEATTQGIDGFSGDYDPAGLARQNLVLRRPSRHPSRGGPHVVQRRSASDRWIEEGFASYYAEQAVLQTGLPDHAPRR